jgi:5-methylcytosine-specific restriction endonuclease McrBC GTP-binding regulatory subunit McrB
MQEESNAFDEVLGIESRDGYGNFFIPENVYIIGTMNDIDRSVESFDFAMRRRFIWQEIEAEDTAEEMFKAEIPQYKGDELNRLTALNTAIGNIEGLGSSYHIGGAYFLLKNEQGDFKEPDYDELWKLRLEPLLREYLRGRHDAKNELEKLKAAYKRQENI